MAVREDRSNIELTDSNEAGYPTPGIKQDETSLKADLPAWQIFMIAVGGVIGITIFSTHGEILRLAGPGGLLVATLFVVVTMLCVMECIAELLILWPVSNAMFEYVKVFVDEDLAIVTGIAYWYTFSCVLATMTIVAADLSKEWIPQNSYRYTLFYFVIPFVLLAVNRMGVKWYGWVEGIGGVIKLAMVIAGIVALVVAAVRESKTDHGNNLEDGLQHDPILAKSNFEAICIGIPILAYGYIGTEIVSVTAFEARNRDTLSYTAKYISYAMASLYAVCAFLQAIVVPYTNEHLQNLAVVYWGMPKQAIDHPIIRIAMDLYISRTAGAFFTWFIIYFCISAANTALYVSSRTLFGLTRELVGEDVDWYFKPLRLFGTVSLTKQVPHYALLFSFFAFCWLIPLVAVKGYGVIDLLYIMGTTSSIGAYIVWASQCLAYIRYHSWLHSHKVKGNLEGKDFARYNRWNASSAKPRTVMASISPVPAWVGLINCSLIVFVLSTASWWNKGDATFKKIATGYAGPVILTVIFGVLKVRNQRGWQTLTDKREQLVFVHNLFNKNKNYRFREEESGGRHAQPSVIGPVLNDGSIQQNSL